MPIPDEPPVPLRVGIELPPDVEVGVFADFASIWHTPATFVLDFVSVKGPTGSGVDEEGNPMASLNARVAARVRIPPEQIFPIIEALQVQSQEWLSETGRATPPPVWMNTAQAADEAIIIDTTDHSDVPPADEEENS